MQFTQETAIVSHTEDGYVFLKTQKASACENCVSKLGCGRPSLFKVKPKNHLKVINTLDLNKGDSVIIAMAPNKLLLGTVLMYIFPLVMLFIFAGIGQVLVGETIGILTGLGGLFMGLFFVKKLTSRHSMVQQFEPKLLRKTIRFDAIN